MTLQKSGRAKREGYLGSQEWEMVYRKDRGLKGGQGSRQEDSGKRQGPKSLLPGRGKDWNSLVLQLFLFKPNGVRERAP